MHMEPFYLINFKAYPQGVGKKALELAKVIDSFAKQHHLNLAVAVQPTDLAVIATGTDLPVYAQHLDPVTPGSHTGHVLPEAVKDAGALGTLLNHSECQVAPQVLSTSIERAKSVGLNVIACAPSPEKAGGIARMGPDYVAIEPPELIGGDTSVSTAKPEVITAGLEQVGSVPLLVGAGVKTYEDVKIAMERGAVGVLLASGVVKADDPEQALKALTGK